MAEELSIEETNILRSKLGLSLLAVPARTEEPSQESALLESIADSKQKRQKIQATAIEEEEEEELLKLSEQALDVAKEGDILVLDDVSVLDTERAKTTELIITGTLKKTKEEEEKEKQRREQELKKRTFVSVLARGEGTESIPKIKEELPKSIPGATLFQSDLETGATFTERKDSKKKRARKVEIPKEQIKINRRTIHRGNTLFSSVDDEDGLIGQPKGFGNASTTLEEDELDELELALTQTRKNNIQKAKINEVLTNIEAQSVPKDGEIYIPTSSFAQVEIKKDNDGNSDIGNKVEQMRKKNTPVPNDMPPPPILFDLPKHSASNKRYSRGVGSTLDLLKESGNLEREEIIVGRANDAAPIKDLNKPGDLVVLEYRDDHGRLLAPKEAYRQLKYQFRGEGPGPRKQQLRDQQLQRQQTARDNASKEVNPTLKDLLQNIKKDHLVLWKN